MAVGWLRSVLWMLRFFFDGGGVQVVSPIIIAVISAVFHASAAFDIMDTFYLCIFVVVFLIVLRALLWFCNPVIGYYRSPGLLAIPRTYVDPNASTTTNPFPMIDAPATLYISLIVPAYNEEERLPVMMDETLAFL